jgi:hypothetical protein
VGWNAWAALWETKAFKFMRARRYARRSYGNKEVSGKEDREEADPEDNAGVEQHQRRYALLGG